MTLCSPVSPHTSDALVDLLVTMLSVPPVTDSQTGVTETHTQWIASRAASIAMVLLQTYVGDCRRCGAVPLREASDITERLELETTERTRP